MIITRLTHDRVAPVAKILQQVWPDWYGPQGNGDALADVRARCGADLPLGWIAIQQGGIVGTVALTETSYGASEREGPWLAGLCTVPSARKQGIATALIATVEAQHAGPIFTTTREAAPLFTRRGWQEMRSLEDGWRVYKSRTA